MDVRHMHHRAADRIGADYRPDRKGLRKDGFLPPQEARPETWRGERAMIEVTSYTELIGGIQARIGELGIRHLDFDKLAGFPEGLTGKAFGPSQVKRLGPEKLFDAIRAAGLKLSLEPDPEQLEKMQKQISEKCQVRQGNQARMNNHNSPVSSALMGRVFKHFSRLGNKKRWHKVSKKKRSEHATMMVNARWKKERKRRKAARARRAGEAHKAANAERQGAENL